MVTSPSPIDGKSTTLVNLATVMAHAGMRVIVVDSDLRRPMLNRFFQLSNSGGLSNAILQPNRGVADHLRVTDVDNLWVLPSGSLPPNPAELLASDRMGAIIEELEGRADAVIFDSPPVLAVTDAAVLSAQVDGVLMVVKAGHTRRAEARKAVEVLQRVGANLLGTVLNDLSTQHRSHYYYYNQQADEQTPSERQERWRSWLRRLGQLVRPRPETLKESPDRR
jgi:non-specific protein-tyrosine kinase